MMVDAKLGNGRSITNDNVLVFNLFYRCDLPDLYCAVPNDQEVPNFLSEEWQFAGTTSASGDCGAGIRIAHAISAANFSGYHLFMRIRVPRESKIISMEPAPDAITLPLHDAQYHQTHFALA